MRSFYQWFKSYLENRTQMCSISGWLSHSCLLSCGVPPARVLTYSSYDVDAGHLFKLLGWKSLACQQQITRATMVYRSLHGLAPNYLSSKFERRDVAYNLRDSENKLNVPLPRTSYYKNSFNSAIVAPFSGTVFLVT